MFITINKNELKKIIDSLEVAGLTTIRINTDSEVSAMVSNPIASSGYRYAKLNKIDTIYNQDVFELKH
jgi:hypothetical protein